MVLLPLLLLLLLLRYLGAILNAPASSSCSCTVWSMAPEMILLLL
jgi:hypothetical protein